jgi:hypothetical protein
MGIHLPGKGAQLGENISAGHQHQGPALFLIPKASGDLHRIYCALDPSLVCLSHELGEIADAADDFIQLH